MRSNASETESVGTESLSEQVFRSLPEGSVIAGRYEIRTVLGSGGYAIVYLAFDRQLGVEVALKALRSDRASAAALTRFRREVRVARGHGSPYLVRIYDIGVDGDLWYLTMEVVRGRTLRERLSDGAMPIDDVLKIAVSTLHGISALHTAGIIHRDIKPENILLDCIGNVKLADFGLARFLDEASRTTVTGAVIGTTDYLSPEQALNRDVDVRSDLYSLGVVVFEMLTGRIPFPGASSLGSVLARLREQAPNVRSFRSDVPLWLSGIVTRLLDKEPARRFATAVGVLEAIERRRIDYRPYTARVASAIAAAVLVSTGLLFAPLHETTTRFARLATTKNGIAAVGRDGGILWEKKTGLTDVPRYALARIQRGKPPVIATVLTSRDDFSPASRRTLSFIDSETGAVVRQAQLPDGGEWFHDDPDRRDAPNRYWISGIHAVDIDRDGIDEVVVSYSHLPEAPSYFVLYEPVLDRARVVFIARGGHAFAGIQDLDGDGRPEMIFAGINNGFNWFNAMAAVRLRPWIGESYESIEDGPMTSPDMATYDPNLLWYMLLPRGRLPSEPTRFHWDAGKRLITIDYMNRQPVVTTFDGFLVSDRSAMSVQQREQLRREAYVHARETNRLLLGGFRSDAVREARDAVTTAEKAGDSELLEWMQRALGKTLIRTGLTAEGDALMERLAATSENASEVAYDAGIAFHLRGDIDHAVEWYKRGIGRGAPIEIGKSKHEYIQAIVFALAERGEWSRALQEIDVFDRTYSSDIAPKYREFVRWRSGGTPHLFDIAWNATDLEHYWILEFRNANNEDPAKLLVLVEKELAEQSEPVAPLWSLKAELLSRLGRTSEAADAARHAWEIGVADAKRNLIARGHLSLIRERMQRYGH